MAHVLVVGAAGFIGRHVVRRLLADKVETVAMDMMRLPAGAFGNEERLRWASGPADDRTSLDEALDGCHSVVYLVSGSLPATANSHIADEIHNHVAEALAVAEFCDARGVRSFVFASSGGTVYGIDSFEPISETAPTHPRNAYGVSKLAIEHYLRVVSTLRSMKVVSLRISNPYGEGQVARRGQGFIAAAMEAATTGQVLPIWGDGSVVRDYVHVDDVAAAICAALRYEGDEAVINIGSAKGVDQLQIVRSIESISRRRVNVEFSPDRPIDVRANVLNISLAHQELGWAPTIPLEQGLAWTWQWWSSGGANRL